MKSRDYFENILNKHHVYSFPGGTRLAESCIPVLFFNVGWNFLRLPHAQIALFNCFSRDFANELQIVPNKKAL